MNEYIVFTLCRKKNPYLDNRVTESYERFCRRRGAYPPASFTYKGYRWLSVKNTEANQEWVNQITYNFGTSSINIKEIK